MCRFFWGLKKMLKKMITSLNGNAEVLSAIGDLRWGFEGLRTRQEELRAEVRTSIEGLRTGQEELRAGYGEVRTSIEGLRVGQEELRASNDGLRIGFEGLRVGHEELRTGFAGLDTRFGDLEKQFQYQRVDIQKMKEEILGAFDASSNVPEISLRVQKHEGRIEHLEQRATAVDTAIRNMNNP